MSAATRTGRWAGVLEVVEVEVIVSRGPSDREEVWLGVAGTPDSVRLNHPRHRFHWEPGARYAVTVRRLDGPEGES